MSSATIATDGPPGLERYALSGGLGRLLEVDVERGGDLQPALECAARAEAVDELLTHPGREVRRPRAHAGGLDVAGDRLLAGVEVRQPADHPLLEHDPQHEVSALARGHRVADRVVGARVGDDPGQHRRLVRAQESGARAPAAAAAAGVVGAEVRPRGRLDAVGAVAEVDRVQVLGEDLRLGPLARQVVGQRRLAQLLEQRALVLGAHRVLDELLGDRRAALDGLLLDDVLDERAPDAADVDARVAEEAAVLDRDDRVAHARRDLAVADQEPALVVGQDAELTAVDVVEHRVAGVLVLLAVLQVGQVGRDRHHHPEHRRDEREERRRHEHDEQPQLLQARPARRLKVEQGRDVVGSVRVAHAARRGPQAATNGGDGGGSRRRTP